LEKHWSVGHEESAPVTKFFEQAEEFIVTRVVNFLALVFPCLQNLGYFVLVGLLLMLLAVTSYPFQPRNEFLFFNWVVILSFMGTIFWIFVQMDRDTVLSILNGGKPGQINISRELVLRSFLYIGAPLLALLGAQFPETLGKIVSLLSAAQGGG
jgi:fatty acid desaturase